METLTKAEISEAVKESREREVRDLDGEIMTQLGAIHGAEESLGQLRLELDRMRRRRDTVMWEWIIYHGR